eukprot:3124807-Amphidinium_carterae.1
MALWLQPGALLVNTDCLGVLKAFEAVESKSAINEHLWQLLRRHGTGRLRLQHVRSHQAEPAVVGDGVWFDWNANRLADEYAKLGALQHLQ